MVAEGAEKELEALALDDRLARRIIDHQVGEVRLAGTGHSDVNSGAANRKWCSAPVSRVRATSSSASSGEAGSGVALPRWRRFHRAAT